ncbi:MAG: metal ABC transporter substrate-binding protein, partial [Hyphomicrobiaceae bacterium]
PAVAERLHVVSTTTDLKSLVEMVGGERVNVVSLARPGDDAEEYRPRPQDLVRLKQAQLVVRVGLDFDLWLDNLIKRAERSDLRRGRTAHIDASFGVTLLDVHAGGIGPGDGHAHGSGNPHFWLDPKNGEIVTAHILERLAEIDPAHAKLYETNRLAFLDRLAAKLRDWESALAPVRDRPLVVYHNTWAYFARRFRLAIAGIVEPRPGVPPSPSHLAALLKTMQTQNVKVLVRDPREPEKNVAFLAGKTGARVALLAGSVGAAPGADDYISLFDANVQTLRTAFGLPPAP